MEKGTKLVWKCFKAGIFGEGYSFILTTKIFRNFEQDFGRCTIIDHGRIVVFSCPYKHMLSHHEFNFFENLSMYSQPKFSPPSLGAPSFLFKSFEFQGEPWSGLLIWNCVYPEWGLLVQMVMKNCVVELSKGVAVAFSSTKVIYNAG